MRSATRDSGAAALREFLGFCGWVLGAGLVLGALGYLPTRRFAGEGAVAAMFGALAAVTLGSIIGGLPILLARRRGAAKPGVVMSSMLVRLVAVVLLAAALALGLDLPTGPFLVWLALSYLLLLVVDTRYAMAALASPPSDSGGPAGG
jgi:hypothetical protein